MRNTEGVLVWFTAVMKHKLDMNDSKGGWENEHPKDMLMCLLVECTELAEALQKSDWDNVVLESADVANFAMMIADIAKKRVAR